MFIQTEDLVKAYKERNAVNGVSIRVDQGQIVGLLGPNGAGKTTTFYMIVGIERPTAGKITIDGKDITRLPIHKRAAYGIGYLPQEASIFRKLTVEDNLLAMLETTKLSKKEQREKAEALMEEFSITQLRDRLGIQLSGGERQMVAMARALMMKPSVLLLDEPSAGLSPMLQDETFIRVRQVNKAGVSVVIVEQNARRCLQICDRGYVLDQGRNAYSGKGRDLMNDPKVVSLYLGNLEEEVQEEGR